MNRTLRFFAALTICLSGWALVPFAALPNAAVGWEKFAEAYGDIFVDGFESGDLSGWSIVVPRQTEIFRLTAPSGDEFNGAFRLGDSALTAGPRGHVQEILVGLTVLETPIFTVESRRQGRAPQIRARARRDDDTWVETPWRAIRSGYGAIQVEWRRSLDGTADGLLYLSVDDDLLLWLVDLDNSSEALDSVGVVHLGGQPTVHRLD